MDLEVEASGVVEIGKYPADFVEQPDTNDC
jgi:hypothetical protein